MKNKVTTRYQYVDVKSLRVDAYQREIDPLRIKKIIKDFDINLLGVIVVSLRDGMMNVIDGQHRVMVCMALGIKHVMAEIKEGMTLEEEAKYFNACNGANGESKPLKAHDVFKAKIVGKDEEALGLERIAANNGLKFGKASGTNTLVAYKTITNMYRKDGPMHIDRVLSIIKASWGGSAISFHNNILVGVSEFVKVYGFDRNYSDKNFIKQMSKVDPSRLVREIKSDTTTNVTKVKSMNSLFKYYNLGLRNRLENNLHFSMR